MKKLIALFLVFHIFLQFSFAQFYIEPTTGYKFSTGTTEPKFKMLNTGFQLAWKYTSHYELLLQLQYSWPISSNAVDSAFTLNPSLPINILVPFAVKPSISSIAIGHRFKITTNKSPDILSILLYTGVAFQQIKVSYQYNKSDYILLNPLQTQQRIGLFLSTGLEYMRQLENGRVFFQALIATPSSGRNKPPPPSLAFKAIISLNAGYSIMLKKYSHGKKKD